MAGKGKGAAWKLGIASGLVAIAALWVRRAKPAPTPGVKSKDRLVNDTSAPCAVEPKKDEPAEGLANPPAKAKPVESAAGLNDREPFSAPPIGANVTARLPIKSFLALKAAICTVVVCLVVLAVTAVYNAAQTYGINRSISRLLAIAPQLTWAAAEGPMQMEQRAWIGFSPPQTHPLISDGGGFGIELRNFGRTPALQTLVTDYVVIEELDKLTGAQETPSYHPVNVGTLMPGNAFATEVRFKTSAEGVQSLSAGKVRVVNYAVVTYEDIFHRKHTSRSCFYWHGGLPAPLPCEDFNTAD